MNNMIKIARAHLALEAMRSEALGALVLVVCGLTIAIFCIVAIVALERQTGQPLSELLRAAPRCWFALVDTWR